MKTLKLTHLSLSLALSFSAFAGAAERDAEGYYLTGTAIQSVDHFIFSVDVFTIHHYIKTLAGAKTPRAVVDALVRKRFVLAMLRDVDCERLRDGFKDGYVRNGYRDNARVAGFLSPLACDEVAKGSRMVVSFDPDSKITSLAVPGRPASKVEGIPFMKATWNLWFGDTVPRKLGAKLVAKI
jgi:hypothetical protein